MREWFEMVPKASGGGDVFIRGYIGPAGTTEKAATAADFARDFQALVVGRYGELVVRIDSVGGDVATGRAVYDELHQRRHRVVCVVEGVAYSMASMIALAGRQTHMRPDARLMLHEPTGTAQGTAKTFRGALDALEAAQGVLVNAYVAKTGLSRARVVGMMEATTFMSASEARALGFADGVLPAEAAPADSPEAFVGCRIAACDDAGAWAKFYEGEGERPKAPAARRRAPDPYLARVLAVSDRKRRAFRRSGWL